MRSPASIRLALVASLALASVGCAGVEGAIVPSDVGATRVTWGASCPPGQTCQNVHSEGKENPFGLAVGVAPSFIYGSGGVGSAGKGFGVQAHVDATFFGVKGWGIGLTGGYASFGVFGHQNYLKMLGGFAGPTVAYQLFDALTLRGGVNYIWANVGTSPWANDSQFSGSTGAFQLVAGADLLLTRTDTHEWVLRVFGQALQSGTASFVNDAGLPVGGSAAFSGVGVGAEAVTWF